MKNKTNKIEPLGICDLCKQPFPEGVGLYYLDRHIPRRYCNRQCVATANSRAGNPIKKQKMKGRLINTRITPASADYIRQGVAAGKSYSQIARELGVSITPVSHHAKGLIVRQCKNCGKVIRRGEWCSAPECHRAGDRVRDKHRRKQPARREYQKAMNKQWNAEHPDVKFSRKTWGIESGKRIELVCETCGKRFKRAKMDQDDRAKRGYKHIYCSLECSINRFASAKAIKASLKNIEVLSKLIDKEKPKERKYNAAHDMRQLPESENHMKEK